MPNETNETPVLAEAAKPDAPTLQLPREIEIALATADAVYKLYNPPAAELVFHEAMETYRALITSGR